MPKINSSLIKTYLHKRKVIGEIKQTARKLKNNGLKLELPDRSGMRPFPSSRLSIAGLTLHKTGLLEKVELVDYFLVRTEGLLKQIAEEMGPDVEFHLDLKSALEQFLVASGGFKPDKSEEIFNELLLDAIRNNIERPAERALAEEYNDLMQIVKSQNNAQDIKEVCQEIVENAKKNFEAANPSMMLYEENLKGQGFLVPIAVAMTETARMMGEKARGKKLGEHRILVTPKSENIYVQKFLEGSGEIINCGRISRNDFIKISGDFIDAKIVERGKYWPLFLTAFASYPGEDNTLLMIPLTITEDNGDLKKIGIFAVLRKGTFSPQEIRKAQLFSEAAASVVQAKQNQEYLIEANLKLKGMQDQLVRDARVKAMGEIAAKASHTFKNLLDGSVGINEGQRECLNRVLDLAKSMSIKCHMGLPVNKEMERLLEMIVETSNLVNLNQDILIDSQKAVRGVLFFARKGGEECATVPVKKYFEQRLAFHRLLAELNKNLDFKVETSKITQNDGIFIIEEDLGDILDNLIKNAFEAFDNYEPKGPKEVVVSARREDELIVISVKDNAKGISSDRLPTIFTARRTTKEEGSGFGMATVKEKVKKHGGYITLESKIDEGTTIEIRFPYVKVDPAKESPIPVNRGVDKKEMLSLTRGKSVMLVEDEKVLNRVLNKALIRMGFKDVAVFSTAEKAFEAIISDNVVPDLIISDQSLPGKNGDQLFLMIDEFYKRKEKKRPELIIHSGNPRLAKDDPAGKAIAELGVQWVEKGGPGDLLKNTVARILKGDVETTLLDQTTNPILKNPIYKFCSRIVHKVNNGITAFLNFDGIENEKGTKWGKESIKELQKFWEGLQTFADAARPDVMEKQRQKLFEKFRSGTIEQSEYFERYEKMDFENYGMEKLKTLNEDKEVQGIWQAMEGSRVKLAVVAQYYLSQIAEIIPDFKTLLIKEQWNDEDFEFLKNMVSSKKLTIGIEFGRIPEEVSAFCEELLEE